ncbi:cilia- and flagella-associated protein 410-like [Watersipora subatra]|uniref:cilia- and flagella-associated protein 410-like n=1 Tax=Watersipora subatra TaxID=2589382 RepID=UPI00355C7307
MVKLTPEIALSRCRSSNLANVKKLNCWSSDLDDISLMKSLVNVEIVGLSVNDITTLEPFQNCKNLQELYIRKNKIADLNEICYLKKLPKLRALWLADNPCATGSLYRMTVLKNLPNLTKLDNIVVESEELNDALEQGLDLCLPDRLPELSEGIESQTSESKSLENGGGESGKALSLAQTNKVREELGLKPLAEGAMGSPARRGTESSDKSDNILQSVLLLVKELDGDGLNSVVQACKARLETL